MSFQFRHVEIEMWLHSVKHNKLNKVEIKQK
jgi:hypothetical protein